MMLDITPTPESPITLEQFFDDIREHTLTRISPSASDATETPCEIELSLHEHLCPAPEDVAKTLRRLKWMYAYEIFYRATVVTCVLVLLSAIAVYSGAYDWMVR